MWKIVIFLLLGFMGISGLTTEAGRIIVEGFPGYEKWSFVGYFIADLLPIENGIIFHRISWILHVISFFIFLLDEQITLTSTLIL